VFKRSDITDFMDINSAIRIFLLSIDMAYIDDESKMKAKTKLKIIAAVRAVFLS
jgi:hypothetical protein